MSRQRDGVAVFEPGRTPSVARNPPVVGPRRATTDDLLVAAGGGDVHAFGAFYDVTAPMVLGVVERVLGRPSRTEQVVEEIYLVLWRDAPAFDPDIRSADAALLATVRRVLVRPVRAMVTATRARRPGDGLRCRRAAATGRARRPRTVTSVVRAVSVSRRNARRT